MAAATPRSATFSTRQFPVLPYNACLSRFNAKDAARRGRRNLTLETGP